MQSVCNCPSTSYPKAPILTLASPQDKTNKKQTNPAGLPHLSISSNSSITSCVVGRLVLWYTHLVVSLVYSVLGLINIQFLWDTNLGGIEECLEQLEWFLAILFHLCSDVCSDFVSTISQPSCNHELCLESFINSSSNLLLLDGESNIQSTSTRAVPEIEIFSRNILKPKFIFCVKH